MSFFFLIDGIIFSFMFSFIFFYFAQIEDEKLINTSSIDKCKQPNWTICIACIFIEWDDATNSSNQTSRQNLDIIHFFHWSV